ncbi:MAG: hypothetical protein JJU20_03860 [Opitutales bacterium]|nr:hypothetical protein [Opitutales bacterium]
MKTSRGPMWFFLISFVVLAIFSWWLTSSIRESLEAEEDSQPVPAVDEP